MTLCQLPWEYLNDGQRFLCLDQQVSLVRVPGDLDQLPSSKSIAPPLRILVVIASPEDQAEIEIERELSIIQESLDEAQQLGLVTVDYLDNATFTALATNLTENQYHILHYIGHGVYVPSQEHGYLCFENAEGHTDQVGVNQLGPLLAHAKHLRLVTLSTCQGTRITSKNAFDSVAMGLLYANIPAVLSVQSGILDESITEMLRLFYSGVTQGQTLVSALQQARLALQALDEDRQPVYRRFDWGIPVLYSRSPALRLINPTAKANVQHIQKQPGRNIKGLPLPRIFVGRRAELQSLRHSLRHRLPIIYLWGATGIGKSTLVAKFIERPGIALDDILVIRCHELQYPTEALGKLANFWRRQGQTGHMEAANLLLNTRHPPTTRARKAVEMTGERRYLIVFDNLDAWFPNLDQDTAPQLTDNTLRDILRGLITAQSGSTFLFTARTMWAGLDSVPEQNRVDLHLADLTSRQSLLLMDTLPRLRRTSLSQKTHVYRHISGHPKTLTLLDSWLSDGRSLDSLLSHESSAQSSEQWEAYFIKSLMSRLSDQELGALAAISVLETTFNAAAVNKMTNLGTQEARTLLNKWWNLSLVQFEHTDNQKTTYYSLLPSVREYILERLDGVRFRTLHARAAVYYGAPFLEEARKRVMGRNSAMWGDEQIEWLARSSDGILGIWARQTRDLAKASAVIQRALAWQYHLVRTGQIEPATDIIEAIIPVLDRQGERDYARAILQQHLELLQGQKRALALMQFANRVLGENRFSEALTIYENAYKTFAALNDKGHVAQTLHQMSRVHQHMATYDQALEKSEAALHVQRHIGDQEGQAASLCQLASLYSQKQNFDRALSNAIEAEKLSQTLDNDLVLAQALYIQGHVFASQQQPIEAMDKFMKSIETASRIGEESITADSMVALGRLLLSLGQIDQAQSALLEAYKIQQRHPEPKIGLTLELLGQLNEKQGKLSQALEKYQQARRIYQKAASPNLAAIKQHITRVKSKLQG